MSQRVSIGISVSMMALVVSSLVSAQTTAVQSAEGGTSTGETESGSAPEAAAGESPDEETDVTQRLDEQEKRLDALEARTDAQQEENKRLKHELELIRDDVALMGAAADTVRKERLFSVFGFFDLTFFKGFFEKDAVYNAFLPAASSFSVTNANVYFKSEMTDSLSAIMELRFSFLPHGFDTQLEDENHLSDGTVVSSGNPYERTDTTIMDPYTTLEFEQGGMSIERVHLTYSPFEWLNVVAGRFLTPYGIWNVDHGSPVVIPARIPNLQYREIMPLAQTGLQVYGRFFPSDTIFLDYAVTLSNGRGPVESLMDLDENKGVGARFRLNYTGNKVSLFAGTYGYFGDYTDIKKRAVTYLTEDYATDMDAEDPIAIQLISTEAYREYAVSWDFMMSFFSVTLQAEAILRRVRHSVHPEIDDFEALLAGASIQDTVYTPDYIGWGFYVLAAYDIPLPLTWLKVTPYVVFDKANAQEVVDFSNITNFTAGLNIKPSPYVTLKAEYMRTWLDSKLAEPFSSMTLQLAVSF